MAHEYAALVGQSSHSRAATAPIGHLGGVTGYHPRGRSLLNPEEGAGWYTPLFSTVLSAPLSRRFSRVKIVPVSVDLLQAQSDRWASVL